MTWIDLAKLAASLVAAGVVAEVLMFILGMAVSERLGDFCMYLSMALVGVGALLGFVVGLHFLWT